MTEDKVKKAAQDAVNAWDDGKGALTVPAAMKALKASLTPSREEQGDWLNSYIYDEDFHPKEDERERMFDLIIADLRKGESK